MGENGAVYLTVPSVPTPSSDEEVHVLAIDDNMIDQKLIACLLSFTSCKVTILDSGKQALQFLGIHEEEDETCEISLVHPVKVDLIMTDYCMPEMNGFELLQKIKASSVYSETPVVIMSSDNVRARIQECMEAGAEDFVIKPVKLHEIEKLVGLVNKGQGVLLDNSSTTEELDDDDGDISDAAPYLSPSLSPSSSPPSGQWSPAWSESPTGDFHNLGDSA